MRPVSLSRVGGLHQISRIYNLRLAYLQLSEAGGNTIANRAGM